MSRFAALTFAAGIVIFASMMAMAVPANAAPGQRVDFKILVVSENGNEPSFDAWRSELRREGVPFDVVVATAGHAQITAGMLATGARANYQAVVLTNGTAAAGLSGAEKAALESFETTFGIRQVTGFVYPSADYGLYSPTSAGSMAGVVGSLTPDGRSAFPYLVGPVPYAAEAYGYLAAPCMVCVGRFTTLVSGPQSSSLVGVYRHPSGREELVATVDSNPSMIHSQLLRHGMLSWVTKGVYLGAQRNYLGLQIDDAFYEDDRWDEVTNTTPEPSPQPIRMIASDVTRAVNWMASKNLKLEMVFNGDGASATDPLTTALLGQKNKFNWINHTWSHEQLDNATLAVIDEQIQKNIDWARVNKVPINKAELVTGEHSGLANPNMPQALRDTKIGWIAADNSRQPAQYAIGPAFTVPRYPANVFYNAAKRSEQLDEYNYIYMPFPDGACVNTEVTTCRSTPATWTEYTDAESSIIFGHLMGNDPRPHFFHQSNLAEDGILYDVLNKVVDRYKSYFLPPIVQLSHTDDGILLGRQDRWTNALAAGTANAYTLNGQIYVLTSATLAVPLTGTTLGGSYGGENSGWITVNSGPAVAFTPAKAVDPVNTSPPAVTGTAYNGATLSASAGAWTSSATPTYAYQWQRCDSAGACINISGATNATYTITPPDMSSRLRVVVTAFTTGGPSTGVSELTSIVTEAPTPPANTAVPVVTGTAQVGQTLSGSTGTWTGSAPLSYAYQWQRWGPVADPSAPWAWGDIAGATGATYSPVEADVDHLLRVTVTATNTAGSSTASSEATASVVLINSSFETDTTGWWGNGATISSDTAFAYSGTRSLKAVATNATYWAVHTQAAISGATAGKTYSLQARIYVPSGSALIGQSLSATIRELGGAAAYAQSTTGQVAVAGWNLVEVTRTIVQNDRTSLELIFDSSGPHASGDTFYIDAVQLANAPPVVATAPANTAVPVVTGTAQVGQTLSGSTGTWTGSAPLSYAYQWQRWGPVADPSAPWAWGDIAGATGATYSPVEADVDHLLRVTVTATNTAGSSTASSEATASVVLINSSFETDTTGWWGNGATISSDTAFAYSGTRSLKAVATNATYWAVHTQAAISGATAGRTYSLQARIYVPSGSALIGQYLYATIRELGGAAAYAQSTTGQVAVAGWNLLEVTRTIVQNDRTALELIFDTDGPRAIGDTIYIDAVQLANAPPVVATAPANTAVPVVTGTAQVGQTLSGSTGTWTGSAPLSYAYQWQRWGPVADPSAPWAWADIAGATGATYSPVEADVDHVLRVTVTATNTVGSSTASSEASASVLLINSSFETDTTGWWGNGATISSDAAFAYSGTRSLKAVATNATYWGVQTQPAISGATAGRTYSLQARIYVPSGSALIGQSLYATIRELGGAATYAQNWTGQVAVAGWNLLEVTRTIVQNDRTSLELIFDTDGPRAIGDTIYIDAVQLANPASATPAVAPPAPRPAT